MEYERVSAGAFVPTKLNKHNKYVGKGKKKLTTMCCDYCCLDTETSHDNEEGWIYQWCLSYPKDENTRYLVYGRKPSELVKVLEHIRHVNELDADNKLIIYVHNLSYDYTYFHNFLEASGNRGELLAVGSHRIITYTYMGLEFRDSLKIAMKSLDKWSKELNTPHRKLVGKVDYSVTRYQNTPLTRNDWRYMFGDVIVLDECIARTLEIYKDKIWTIPLTKTGYVRRETRKTFKKDASNRRYFNNKRLNKEKYIICKNEFSGGITHGNRYYMGKTVNGKIKHRDFASHYPTQQICNYCPSTPFVPYFTQKKGKYLYLSDLKALEDKNYCYLCTIQISEAKIKDGVTLPYLQYSKVLGGKIKGQHLDCVQDNGRVLQMLDGYTILCVNEIDLKWINKQYTFKYKILSVYVSIKGQYPKYLRDTVNKFFYEKSFYKSECKRLIQEGFSEDSEEYRDTYLNMMISKGMLNSIYGMSGTDPVRVAYSEEDNGEWKKEELSETDIEERLTKFYSGRNNFMNYELGLWTTSGARDELMNFVELIGYENFLYADTDSIFYLSTPEIEKRIEDTNKSFRTVNDKEGYFIEVNGKKTYYNQFEDEKEDIIKFRFLHAKCYAFVTSDGQLHATIAGVQHYGRNGNTRVKELGSIENLDAGTVFHDCGGTITKYPPKGYDVLPKLIDKNGHLTEVGSFAIIEETTKELHPAEIKAEYIHFWEVEQ